MDKHLTCKTCGENKPEDDFYIDKRRKSGRQGVCKNCQIYKRKPVDTNNLSEGRLYTCKRCGEGKTKEHYIWFTYQRSRICNDCKETDEDRLFSSWYTRNKNKLWFIEFVDNLRNVTGINGPEDLLRKYKDN